MSLDLGALIGRVVLEDVEFQRTYVRVRRQFADLGASAGEAAAGTGRLDESLAATGASADKAAVGVGRAAKAEADAAAVATRTAAAHARVAEAMAATAGASTRVQVATLRQVAAEDRNIAVQAKASATTRELAGAQAGLIAASDRVAAAQGAAAASTSRWRGALAGTLRTAAGLGLTLGVFEAVKKAIDIGKEAAQFQREMLLIQTQAGASAHEVAAMSAEVLRLAGPVGTAPEKLATSLYHIESVGLRAGQAFNVMRIAAEGAQVGHADLEQTTNALTATVASGIGGVHGMAQAMGALNATVGAGDMRLSDLNDALGTGILTAARVFGVNIREVGAALAVFGDNNIRGQDAATKLRMAMQDLSKPAAHADDFLKKIGTTSAKLREQLMQGGLTGALDYLRKHMEQAGVTGDKVGGFLEDAFTKKAGVGLAVLIAQSQRYHNKLDEITGAAGSFSSRWEATTRTVSFQWSRISAGVDAALIRLAEKAQPALAGMLRWFATSGPHAMAIFWQAVKPVADLVGGALVGAWRTLQPVLRDVGAALTAVGRWMSSNGAVVQRFATVVAGMWGAFKLYRIAAIAGDVVALAIAKMSAASLAGSVALRNFGASLMATGIGVGLGNLTLHASATTKALGVLGSTAGGALAGFALGGPVGAAIGGITGAVSDLAVQLRGTGTAADQGAKEAAAAMQRQQADAKDLLGVLQSVNGAYSAQYRQSIVSKLGQSGALDVLSRLGMNSPNTISTIVGRNGPRALANLYASIENEAAAGRVDYKSMNLLVGAIQHLSPAAAAAEKRFEEQSQAMHGGVLAVNQLNARYNNLRAIFRLTGSTLDDVSAAGLHNRAALTQIAQASSTAAVKAIEHGRAVAQTTMAYEGQQNQLRFNLEALGFQSRAVEDLIGKYKLTPTQIVTKLVADARAGIGTSREFQTIIDAIRQHKVPGLNANTVQGKSIIADLQRRIDLLRGKTVDINVNTNYATNGTPSATGGRAFGFAATGGTVAGGIPGRDSVPIMAMPGEEIINAEQSRKHRALIKAINAGARGFASGGTVGGSGSLLQLVERAGFRGRAADIMAAIVMAESGGNARAYNGNAGTGDNSYGLAQINMLGSMGAARRREFHLSSNNALFDPLTNLRVAYALSGHGSNFTPWTTYTRGLYRRYLGTNAAVAGGGSSGGSSAASSAAAQAANQRLSTAVGNASTAISAVNGIPAGSRFAVDTFNQATFTGQVTAARHAIALARAAGASAATIRNLTARLAELTREGSRYAAALRTGVAAQIRGLATALANPTAGALSTAIATVNAALRRTGASAGTISQVTRAEQQLTAVRGNLLHATSQLASMRTYRAGVGTTLFSQFDPTQAGSVGDLEAGLRGAGGSARAFGAEIAHARAMGLDRRFLAQLIAAGPNTTLGTLGTASRDQVAAINRDLAAYRTTVGSAADAAVMSQYGISIGGQQSIADRYQLEGDLALSRMAAAIGKFAETKFEITLDGHVLATSVLGSREFAAELHQIATQLARGRNVTRR